MRCITLLAATIWLPASLSAQQLSPDVIQHFRWRSVGPANMGGRIVDVAGIPAPSRTFYVSPAGGGLFKTSNAGTTFESLLDTISVASGGMIAIAPSDTNVVYYGTGEPNMRNSISPGGGVWKTADGGRSWRSIGLEKTQHIGRIAVDPRDANVAYVAAAGAAWTISPDRGLYKTTDGGRTWNRLKHVSDSAGFIDVAIDPVSPRTIWAASYEFLRTPYYVKSGGRGSALWKSDDAGASWHKIEGNGFPAGLKGRIGIALSASGKVVYALVEGAKLRNAPSDTIRGGVRNPITGLYRSADGGATWEKVNDRNDRPFYFSQVRVSPADSNRVYWLGVQTYSSRDGGRTHATAMQTLHVDHHALWIDPADPRHLVTGNDGGIGQSWDGGATWDYINTLAIGQFYSVSTNLETPYRICGGLQDNGNWCGPSRRKVGAITNADWISLGGGDGQITAQSPRDHNLVITEVQGGGIEVHSFADGEGSRMRHHQLQLHKARAFMRWTPVRATQRGRPRLLQYLGAPSTDGVVDEADRRNWTTPFVLSRHDPNVLYVGTNRVVKVPIASSREDSTFRVISPDLTTADTLKIRENRTFRIRDDGLDHTEPESYCTITALAESPVRPGLLVAGTDDGNVWLTRDEGINWENLTERFPGVPPSTYVSGIEPSHADQDVFYVTFDNHRRNDFFPYVYRTADGGHTFTRVANGLLRTGRDYVYVVREHPGNQNTLFAGTESGVFVSIDTGKQWVPFNVGLPTVSIRDLQIHPRDGELIAATHGRSVWIADISPLEQITPAILASSAHLFRPKSVTQYREPYRPGLNGYVNGNRVFAVASPLDGLDFFFWLGADTSGLRLTVRNAAGEVVVKRYLRGRRGLNRASWHGYTMLTKRERLGTEGIQDSIAKSRAIAAFLDSAGRAGEIDALTFERIRTEVLAGEPLYIVVGMLRGGDAPEAERSLPSLPIEWPGESSSQPEPRSASWTSGLSAPVARLLESLQRLGAGARAPYISGGPPAPGTYSVTLTVGEREMRQTFQIERR